MKTKFTLFLSFLMLAFISQGQYKYLKGVLTAAQVGVGVTSSGTGVVIVRYNTATRQLDHFGNFRGLGADITNQHIHTGAPGVNGPVTVPLARTGGTRDGGLFGSQVLTVAQETDLLAGNMYTNIHSTAYPNGEVRAQLTQTTDGQTEFLNGRLQSAQAVQPNLSTATGIVNALVDKATHTLYLTATYTGLLTAANNAHIHTGAPNISGPVIIPLIWVPATSGTLDTSRVINATDEASIISGGTYVNIHTPSYGGGEIRGQLLQASELRFFGGSLQGSQEVPPNASAARGTVIVKYNTATNFLELTGDYQNLTDAATASHIHSPAGPGANAPVLFNLTNTAGTTGTLSGNATLTETEEATLLAGNMYVNVHSITFGGGEIRAQLIAASSGETQYIKGILQPGQSVATPAVVSSGTGTVTALLDRLTRQLYVTGNFSGLTSNINNTHVHGGAAGVNGPVIVPLFFGGTTSGTVTGSAVVRSTFADSIITGLTYLNIHTVNYGAGEIRAQLGDLVLPVKLSFFNGYKNGSQVSLIWESAQELNLDRYEIEQQDESGIWKLKTSIAATGGTLAAKYQANDIPMLSKSGYAFYRLKMVDKDGRYSYSSIVKINFGKSKAELTIQNNPIVNNEIKFTITGLNSNKKASVSIIDFTGRVVSNTTASTFSNNVISIGSLAKGMYKLVIKVDDELLEQSFIK